MKYRHEHKYVVTDLMMEKIRCRLEPVMGYDSYADGGSYAVRSVYFDDLYDSCLKENEDGVNYRKKYRVRIYNNSDGLIKLECKHKDAGMTYKESCAISREEADGLIMAGTGQDFDVNAGRTARKFFCERHSKCLMPKCIVEYDRTAFIERTGNVRITFDKNIRGSTRCGEFFWPDAPMLPVMQMGHHVLEIKYDEILPQYILQLLDIGGLRRQSFSKYCIVRLSTDFGR